MNKQEITRDIRVIKLNGDSWEAGKDSVIMEHSFTLYGNGEKIREFNCCPNEIKELSAGALFSMGKIKCAEDIVSLEVDDSEEKVCAVYKASETKPETETPCEHRKSFAYTANMKTPKSPISVRDIFRMMDENLEPTELFEATGGVHMVSLYDLNNVNKLLKKEDAARHNAVDKILGSALFKGVSLNESILVLSGRVSGEILDKAIRASIPVVLSKSAPTVQSVEKASKAGITLIGFIRKNRMNIYTHPQRIAVPDDVFKNATSQRRTQTLKQSRNLTGGLIK